MRPGDLVFYRHDGDPLRGYVLWVSDPGAATIAIHNDAGMLLFSVADAPIAQDATDRRTDGFCYPRS